ncbi:MAG: response regulator [Ramlibacter sp.]
MHRLTEEDTRRPRILVVDDTPDNLFLMHGLFEDRYDVVPAASGAEGLEVIMSNNPPDIVLLDIMMPGMDGYEVLRRLRQHTPTANIPVIFLTALASRQDQDLGINLGAVDYLTKPVNPEQVVARVEANMQATRHMRRMEVLSERLSRHLSPDVWQRLFHGAGMETIAFRQKALTVLFIESGDLGGWTRFSHEGFMAEVRSVAGRRYGSVDEFGWGGTVVFFEDAGDAVRTALDLQRSAPELKLRMGIHTCGCELGTFRINGDSHCTLIGQETTAAAHVAATAAYGSIVISPDAYALVQELVQQDVEGCLLTEEFQDSDIATASLTPTSSMGSAGSTFAGLGTF